MLGLVLIVAGVFTWRWLAIGGVVILVLGFAGYFRLGRVHAPTRPLGSPVRGRWFAINSPVDGVPSHGLHAYGQTYAVDLVHVPEGDWSLAFGWAGPHQRPADEYPAFGQPVLAPADGTVVRVREHARDHPARTSYLGLALMMVDGALRELTGRVIGNHVVLDVGDGYVMVAHLRRRSVTVRPGQRVSAGDQLAECGNTGNTSEPHVHVQLMDHPNPYLAAGLPFSFTDATTDDGLLLDLPKNMQAMRVA